MAASATTLRVFVHAESSAHRPVFADAVNARRGAPAARLLPSPPQLHDLAALFGELLPGVRTTDSCDPPYRIPKGGPLIVPCR